MPRGVAHSPELRAQVVATVLAGASIAQVAGQYKLDKGLVSRWVQAEGLQPVATEQGARARDLGELILELIADHVTTIQAQLQAAARPDWLEKQSASELAQLVAVERDTTLRLLAGLRPVDNDPAGLPAPADAARSPASDGGRG
jgi:transposase-like protein